MTNEHVQRADRSMQVEQRSSLILKETASSMKDREWFDPEFSLTLLSLPGFNLDVPTRSTSAHSSSKVRQCDHHQTRVLLSWRQRPSGDADSRRIETSTEHVRPGNAAESEVAETVRRGPKKGATCPENVLGK